MKIAPDHLKWVALVALVLQNSGIAILMRFTMINKPRSEQYAPSTAVLWSEVLKLVLSSILCFYFDAKSSWRAFISILQTEGRQDLGKLCVPSVLYTLQNSLQFISICNLSAPVYQVLYQMKIITTAVFSVMILQRRIYSTQWLSIIALAAGVALVQLSQHAHESHAPTSSNAVVVAAGTPLDHPDLVPAHPEPSLTKAPAQNSMIGLISVLCGCLTSGFAGVYFEMVLKASASSIWVRNIQLSVIGIIISAAACYFRDYNGSSQASASRLIRVCILSPSSSPSLSLSPAPSPSPPP